MFSLHFKRRKKEMNTRRGLSLGFLNYRGMYI